jgi:hypothetical protein
MRRVATILLLISMAPTAFGCGASGGEGPLPSTIEHGLDSSSNEPCASWLSPGIDAAYCDQNLEAPAPSGDPVGQIEFTGTPRSGAEGGIAQAAGVLPEGGTIGINVHSPATGTLVAQAICGSTLVRATFDAQHFDVGDRANLAVLRVGDTPVIMLTVNGRKSAPDRERLFELDSSPGSIPMFHSGSPGCAFRVA